MIVIHFYVTVCGELSLQILASKYPLLLVCWRQWRHSSTRLFCIVNISGEQWVQLFSFFDLALKNAVLIKFSFWHRPPREALLRRRRKTGARAWPTLLSGREAQQEGWRGENHLYPFPFSHISISKDPRRLDTQLCLSQEAGRPNAALAWPVTQAVSRGTERRLNTRQTGN